MVKNILSASFLLYASSTTLFGLVIQNFESGSLNPGTSNLLLKTCDVNSPTSSLLAEGTYAINSNSANCHKLWANVAAQGGSNFMVVNGSTAVGNVYQQTVTGVLPSVASTFSGYVTGLYRQAPAGLEFRVYDGVGTGGTLLGTIQFNTGINPPPENPLWAKKSVNFTPISSTVTVQVLNVTTFADGNDFGLDTLDITPIIGGAIINSTPEPSTMLLAGAMLLCMGIQRRK